MVISNKERARDPEGETIFHDLVTKSRFKAIKSVRAGKFLRVEVEARDAGSAKACVEEMCDELRIYNPAAHALKVEVGRLPK